MGQKIFGIQIGKPDNASVGSGKKGKKNTGEPTTPVSTWKKTAPQVNAIPISILEKYENQKLIRNFVKGSIAIAVVGVLVFGYSLFAAMNNQAELDALEARNAEVNAQITELAPYQAFKGNVSDKLTTLSGILETDVDVATLFNTITSTAENAGVSISGLSVTISGDTGDGTAAGAGACPVTDPFTASSAIGCITFDGTQPDASALNSFLDTLGESQGMVDVFVAASNYSGASESSDASNSFNGSVSFTDFFYSQKYGHFATALDDIIAVGGLDAAEDAYQEAINAPQEEEALPEDETTETEGN